MTPNLITDAWLPIRRVDGTHCKIRPAEITDPDIEVVELPRADFQQNAIVFLIGLVQSTMPPEDDSVWLERLEAPPTESELDAAFAPWIRHFELDGKKGRFLQDPAAGNSQTRCDILELLLETPTGQTLKLNKDLFVKRQDGGALCPSCTALALYVLQNNAPEGGRGHNVSLRGGGPLTTLIEGPSLWATIWSNVLSTEDLAVLPGDHGPEARSILPWLMDPIPGGKGGRPTTPEDGHPLMAYWGMPRRLWLDEKIEGHACAVCGDASGPVYTGYRTAANGFQYEGWEHPLAPYRDDKGTLRPVRPPARGLSYRDWMGFIVTDSDNQVTPAFAVRRFEQDRLAYLEGGAHRLRAFGFRTKQNAVLAWQDAAFPLLRVESDRLHDYENAIRDMIRGAQQMAFYVESCTKQALFRRPQDLSGDITYVSAAFWHRTNETFYSLQTRLPDAEGDEGKVQVMQDWHKEMVLAGREVFKHYAMARPFAEVEPRRVSQAWQRLNRSFHGKKMREILRIPSFKKTTMNEPTIEATA